MDYKKKLKQRLHVGLFYLALGLILMLVGIACGLLTGVCANLVMKHLRHMKF